jgi:hypothetical protein
MESRVRGNDRALTTLQLDTPIPTTTELNGESTDHDGDRPTSAPPVCQRRSIVSDPRDFHVPQPAYSKEDLLRSGTGGYFGPGNAQLRVSLVAPP